MYQNLTSYFSPNHSFSQSVIEIADNPVGQLPCEDSVPEPNTQPNGTTIMHYVLVWDIFNPGFYTDFFLNEDHERTYLAGVFFRKTSFRGIFLDRF